MSYIQIYVNLMSLYTMQSRPVIKDPKINSQIEPRRETKPKAEAWQDCTYSKKFQKQPFKGQKGHLKAMSLTFLSLTKIFWVIFESLCKIMGESENIF